MRGVLTEHERAFLKELYLVFPDAREVFDHKNIALEATDPVASEETVQPVAALTLWEAA